MSLPFKTQITNIRKEAISLGFTISTIDEYFSIWNKFIIWKNIDCFEYDENDYSQFLLEHYHFDVTSYSNKSKSRHLQLMRSKRILDDWDSYKQRMKSSVLPKSYRCEFPKDWNVTLENYLNYCKDIRCNGKSSIKFKYDYLTRLLSYFSNQCIVSLSDICKEHIITFINESIDKGSASKRKNFFVLRDFLNYLFIEGILTEDYSIYIPKIKSTKRKRIPTYLKQDDIENLLNNIPKNKKVQIRDYTIILLAARLGLRQSDILNIKLKDIDWKNYKLNITQPKTNNLNTLPLTKELGWAIIDYIKNSRPKCKNEYLFVKMKHPYEKMEHFTQFKKYFDTVEVENTNKKGIHNLRHSFATNLLDNDTPIEVIASALGDTTETTSSTYLKIDKNKLKQCSLEVTE